MGSRDHLAVATVTETLKYVLQKAVDDDAPNVPNARVTHVRPNAPAADLPTTGINVFLYQVTPSAAGRNADLPTRRADGTLITTPRAALVLHYLLSFYGDDGTLEPQILMASAVRALHASPALDKGSIGLAMQQMPSIALSQLADAIDLVRVTPSALSLEEMSKLWSVFFQTPYVLSVAYQASLVFVDAPLPEPADALPVRFPPDLIVAPVAPPLIESVLARTAPGQPALDQPILTGYVLVLTGQNLMGDIVLVPSQVPGSTTSIPDASPASPPLVRIDDVDVPATNPTGTTLDVPMIASVRAGMHSVRVTRRAPFGSPSVPHPVMDSNTFGFSLRPTIGASMAGSAIHVTFSPDLGANQSVSILLNRTGAATHESYRLDAPTTPPRPDGATAIDFDATTVVAGTYLVRAVVDGAESLVGPTVTVP